MEKIYDTTKVNMLLGCLLQDTSLITNDKYPLCKDDFVGHAFDNVMYVSIVNLSRNGYKTISFFDLDKYLQKHEAEYQIFKDCRDKGDVEDFLETIVYLSDVGNYESYYNDVRKCSILRDYREKYNIDEFWDYNKSDTDNIKNLEQYTIENIINYYETIQCTISNKYKVDEDTKEKKFGDNGFEIYQNYKDIPMITTEFESKYLTTLWNGFGNKQLFIRSGDTSSGKSRSILGDLISLGASEKYDLDKKEWIKNSNGGHKCLYIGCEMDLDEEVDSLIWAYISGVESSTIMHRRETKEEDERIKRAIEITKRDGIWGVDMPSFNIRKIEEKVKYYKKKHDIEYLGFDYILLNSALVKEFVQNRGSGVGTRGDEVLLEISKALKDIAKKYNIGIITATQVNADIKDFRNRDYQVLRGGKAIADKASGGSISMPITPQELKLVEPYTIEWNKKHSSKFGMIEPNWVETVYKSRFSEFPKECKIFSVYNLGNMRKIEMYVTDKDFKIIKDIKKTIIEK